MRAIDKLRHGGIRRLGTPKTGFRYVTAHRRPASPSDVERIRGLKLPPAWTDVHVSTQPSAKLQAVGKDAAGRWQYRYHPEFVKRQAAAKFRRLVRFAAALPKVRAAVDRDLRRRGPVRERVLAGTVRILEACFMRPGSEAYAIQNRSYGVATIRPRHVTVDAGRVVFDFRGKSGQRQIRELRDARVARLVRELLSVPGRDVFKFVADGEVVDVRRRHINEYIRAASGGPFTAKDFRTWAGTLLCASELARHARDRGDARKAHKRLQVAAVKAVADHLGNTPAVAKASYISPAVLDGFVKGNVVSCSLESPEALATIPKGGLHEAEKALAEFLIAAAPSKSTKAKLRVLQGGARGPGEGQRKPAGTYAKPTKRAARRAE